MGLARPHTGRPRSSSRPLRLALILGTLSSLLVLAGFSTLSPTTRGRRFALLSTSSSELELELELELEFESPTPAFLVDASASVPAEHAYLPLLPPHSTRPDQRLEHLERLATLDAKLGGFADVGFLGSENALQVARLRTCLEEGEFGGRCSPEGDGAKVVLVGYKYFTCALTDDLDPEDKLKCHSAGETIWMRSMLESFKRNGVFYFNAQPDHLAQMYRWFGDIITHVWAEDGQLVECLSNPVCVASPQNPLGIPSWKLFATTWWGHPEHSVLTDHGRWFVPEVEAAKGKWSWNPLGSEWTLSPYAMPDNITFLGYNIIGCDDIPVLPEDARQGSILLLAKKISYFLRPEAWPLSMYAAIVNATGLSIISSAHLDPEADASDADWLPDGVIPHERMGRKEYEEFVGEMRVLLGVGNPGTSPSPYNALCQGVPVVLPYSSASPTPAGWELFNSSLVQHGPAALLGEPYVYSLSLFASEDEAIETVQRAASTPIDRYIPPDMTVESVDRRLMGILAVDWERLAREKQGVTGDVGEGMLSECRRLGFCGTS